MLLYNIINKEGKGVKAEQFEENLKQHYADYKIMIDTDVGIKKIKIYEIYEGETLLGRIDVTYRNYETAVFFSQEKDEGLVAKLQENSEFRWEKRAGSP